MLLFFLLVAPLPCAGAALDAAISQLLQQRIGLTRREADLVQHRHRKQTGALLQIAELEATIEALPPALLPGHVAHLLRAHPLSSLQGLDPQRHRWCSYKTHVWCSCADACAGPPLLDLDAPPSADDAPPPSADDEPPPATLALDCEFKPLRCVIVDAAGRVRLDALVTKPAAGTSSPPLPGILSCDAPLLRRVALADLQTTLRKLVASGTVIVAHTPESDLHALELTELAEGFVDIAQLGRPPAGRYGPQSQSLKKMAEAHLGVTIQQGQGSQGVHGSRRHCAREDARVTMELYKALIAKGESSESE